MKNIFNQKLIKGVWILTRLNFLKTFISECISILRGSYVPNVIVIYPFFIHLSKPKGKGQDHEPDYGSQNPLLLSV